MRSFAWQVRYLKEGDLDTALPVLAQGFELSSQELGEIRERHQPGVLGRAFRGLF